MQGNRGTVLIAGITAVAAAVMTALLFNVVGVVRAGPGAGPAASPDVPGVMSYQGRLTDPGTGDPVADSTYSITFRIFDVASGGAALWEGTQSVAVSGGLFNVLLGSSSPLPSGVFSGTPRYLEVQVGADPAMTPRQQFVTVPYAFHAVNAWALDGNTDTTAGTNFLGTSDSQPLVIKTNGVERIRVTEEGNVGIGAATDPTELVHILASGASKKDLYIEHILGNGTGLTGVTGAYRPFHLGVAYSATDLGVGVNAWQGVNSTVTYGINGVPATGTVHSSTFDLVVAGSGSDWNEYTPEAATLRFDIGDGFTQSTGPTGRGWLTDFNVHGPVGVQPDMLNGITLFYNNYYDGSPSHSPGGGMWLVTGRGRGGARTPIHDASNTYPVDVGLGIVGDSDTGARGIGFEKAIQIGGYGSGWMESGTSMIGTGVDMRDFVDYGLYIHDRNPSGTGPAIAVASNAGNVGIGTTNPQDKLEVSGGDIRVTGGSFIDDGTTLNVPDYVFEEGYSLMPLGELRAYVSAQRHLPNMPSTEEIRKDGLNLSQFQMLLLEKTEELTLYTLAQEQKLEAQDKQIEALEERLGEQPEAGAAPSPAASPSSSGAPTSQALLAGLAFLGLVLLMGAAWRKPLARTRS